MPKYLIISLLVLSSCSSKDAQFCECLKASESLNEYSQQFIEKRASKEESIKFKELKSNKDSACEAYKDMDGASMKELQKDCEK